MILGAHMSIAGGLETALNEAARHGFETTALFVRNQRQWKAPPLTDAAAEIFRTRRAELNITPVVAHGSYLVNLAGEEAVREKSIAAAIDEYRRCVLLGIDYLVYHPGSHGEEADGIALVVEALTRIFAAAEKELPLSRAANTKILLETTAGQGNSLGCRFGQLAAVMDKVPAKDLLGVCMDTCHLFAAGYELRTAEGYENTLTELDKTVGLARLCAIHLNDSMKDLGSRVDRHAHIGKGKIGLEGFRHVVNDPRLAKLPMILETPKDKDADGREWDDVNAQTLRSLVC